MSSFVCRPLVLLVQHDFFLQYAHIAIIPPTTTMHCTNDWHCCIKFWCFIKWFHFWWFINAMFSWCAFLSWFVDNISCWIEIVCYKYGISNNVFFHALDTDNDDNKSYFWMNLAMINNNWSSSTQSVIASITGLVLMNHKLIQMFVWLLLR